MAQKLYVGNLPFSATTDDIEALFAEYGAVTSVNLITDRETGRPRGFGFVEMEDPQSAIDALDGREFQGRSLTVNVARDRQGAGGGGGGGGGRGRR